jgi:hypothetical protein
MMEPIASSHKVKLHCQKFDRWVDGEDAACTDTDDYCEFRERCGIYFLMTERMGSTNKKAKEERDASL